MNAYDDNHSLRVAAELASERLGQTAAWPVEHDDEHADGSLALVAALYASPVDLKTIDPAADQVVASDPWPWKRPEGFGDLVNDGDKRAAYDRRRRLVVAGALIIAEIERLDRAAAATDGDGRDDDALDLAGHAILDR